MKNRASGALRARAASPARPCWLVRSRRPRRGDGSARWSAPAKEGLQWAHGKTLAAASDACGTACPPEACRARGSRSWVCRPCRIPPRGDPQGVDSAAPRTVESVGGTLMIGPKKLSTIRQELERALTATGEDPIRWLEECVSGRERQGSAAAGENEILRSLRRFLEAPGRRKGRKQRAGARK